MRYLLIVGTQVDVESLTKTVFIFREMRCYPKSFELSKENGRPIMANQILYGRQNSEGGTAE